MVSKAGFDPWTYGLWAHQPSTTQKRFVSTKRKDKREIVQNLDVTCSICGKKHWGNPCYKESEACFGCGKHGHMIRDCPNNKKFIIGKPKEEDKQKSRVQGRMFAMTR